METPIRIDARALKALIKENVREVMKEEWFSLWQATVPKVSDAEQAELEEALGHSPSPHSASEAVDMTDCSTHLCA